MILDIDSLFEELIKRCHSREVYSVKEVAARMGVDYTFVERHAVEDDEKNEILQICRSRCASNAVTAGLEGRLSIKKCNEYWIENDDEYASEWGNDILA